MQDKNKLIIIGLAGLILFGGVLYALLREPKNAAGYTNSIGLEFVLVPAGTFNMGANESSLVSRPDEKPGHRVTISRPFYLGKYEVTQEQWQTVMGSNPSNFRGQTNPVENVSWNDVQEFIRKLNQKEQKKEGHEYRLPTEAEWEYAARAGTKATYFFADDAKPLGNYALNTTLGNYAWYKMNSEGITHPVGGKKPNPWGLYDIYGNVWEWVQDWYAEYPAGAVTDPQGPSAGVDRVYRGGSWGQWSGFNNIEDCRSAYRGSLDPDNRGDFDLGFRLAFSPGQ